MIYDLRKCVQWRRPRTAGATTVGNLKSISRLLFLAHQVYAYAVFRPRPAHPTVSNRHPHRPHLRHPQHAQHTDDPLSPQAIFSSTSVFIAGNQMLRRSRDMRLAAACISDIPFLLPTSNIGRRFRLEYVFRSILCMAFGKPGEQDHSFAEHRTSVREPDTGLYHPIPRSASSSRAPRCNPCTLAGPLR